MKNENRLELDNAATIYPYVIDETITSVFRLEAGMREPVDTELLSHALKDCCRRYPYLYVVLKKNWFGYYLEKTDQPPVIALEPVPACASLKEKGGTRPLVRIAAHDTRITLDFSHIMTDGTGALEFLKTLLAGYVERKKGLKEDWEDCRKPDSPIGNDEDKDAYRRNFDRKYKNPPIPPAAFRLGAPLSGPGTYDITSFYVLTEKLKQSAKRHSATVNDYLACVYLAALQNIYFRTPQRLRNSSVLSLEIPVNLRKLFPSATLRNFTLFAVPQLRMRGAPLDFETIIRLFQEELRIGMDAALMKRMIRRNVAAADMAFLKILPIPLKKPLFRFFYSYFGESQFSGLITNLGPLRLPEWISREVESLSFIPAPSPILKVQCGVIGYGERVYIAFGNNSAETDLIDEFAKILEADGNKPVMKAGSE